MRRILTSCALCAVALSASAQCAAQAHAQHDKNSGWINTASAGMVDPELGRRTQASLVNVAARTPAGMPAAQAGVAGPRKDPAPGPGHRRRTGPAMLIAALAVMSAIALRRLGAADL